MQAAQHLQCEGQGWTPQEISKLENAKFLPTWVKFLRLCEVYEVPPGIVVLAAANATSKEKPTLAD
jgi:transcriptional regulator with XRE-family HTH domain